MSETAYKNEYIERLMNEKGKLPNVSEVGGYTLIYVTDSNSVLCGDCATKEPKEIRKVSTYDEGATMECDGGCGTFIESSYGDPDEEEEDGE